MSRLFTATLCAFTLLGAPVFAQNSMSNGTGNSMSAPTTNTMAPDTMKPSDSMQKPNDSMNKPDTGMSNGNSMAPTGGAQTGAMSHPTTP